MNYIMLTTQQRAFIQSDSDVCAFVGGRISGKTEALLRRAIKAAERRDVAVVGPRLDMTREINGRVIESIESKMSNNQIYVKQQDMIRLRNGSTIYFPSKITEIPKVEQICVDEIQHHGRSRISDIKFLARKWDATIHATGNADTTEYIDPTAVVFSKTADNPSNSYSHEWIERKSFESMERMHEVGDHAISMDKMECVLCGNKEGINIPNNISPTRERTLRVWIFSQFKDMDCVNRLA